MSIYDFSAVSIDGEEISLSKFEGKVLLIVNTASKCGFTPQYKELEELYQKHHDENFEILGFPCNQFGGQEPGNSEEIKNFCEINYGVTFPLFEKINVNGQNAHPLYKYLRDKKSGIFGSAIKWNFTKFLIDSKGNIINRFAPNVVPSKIDDEIKKLL